MKTDFIFYLNRSGRPPLVICAFLLGFLLLQSCATSKDYYNLPAMVSSTTFNTVIEIPAGTNKKYEYDPLQKKFIIDRENGLERVIDFLPYPANYGFVPSTLSKSNSGGDGDALDVLVISEALQPGTVIEIHAVAVLKLIDNGEKDYKIIAVPKDKTQRIIEATTYLELASNYPTILEVIELWFLNYNKNDISSVEGWGNQKEALQEIRLHLKTNKN